jgi:hypothetical protein
LARTDRLPAPDSVGIRQVSQGEKRRQVKGITVAGENKQQDCISKEDASLPTVAIESVLLSCIIDAEEGWDVAVVDIPNAFIQTRVENEKDMVFLNIRGIMVDILVPDSFIFVIHIWSKNMESILVVKQA